MPYALPVTGFPHAPSTGATGGSGADRATAVDTAAGGDAVQDTDSGQGGILSTIGRSAPAMA